MQTQVERARRGSLDASLADAFAKRVACNTSFTVLSCEEGMEALEGPSRGLADAVHPNGAGACLVRLVCGWALAVVDVDGAPSTPIVRTLVRAGGNVCESDPPLVRSGRIVSVKHPDAVGDAGMAALAWLEALVDGRDPRTEADDLLVNIHFLALQGAQSQTKRHISPVIERDLRNEACISDDTLDAYAAMLARPGMRILRAAETLGWAHANRAVSMEIGEKSSIMFAGIRADMLERMADDCVAMPTNAAGHWSLLVWHKGRRTFYIVDSLGDGASAHNLIAVLRRFVPEICGDARVKRPEASSQSDGVSCGIFVLEYMRSISRSTPHWDGNASCFSETVLPSRSRVRMLRELRAGKLDS